MNPALSLISLLSSNKTPRGYINLSILSRSELPCTHDGNSRRWLFAQEGTFRGRRERSFAGHLATYMPVPIRAPRPLARAVQGHCLDMTGDVKARVRALLCPCHAAVTRDALASRPPPQPAPRLRAHATLRPFNWDSAPISSFHLAVSSFLCSRVILLFREIEPESSRMTCSIVSRCGVSAPGDE